MFHEAPNEVPADNRSSVPEPITISRGSAFGKPLPHQSLVQPLVVIGVRLLQRLLHVRFVMFILFLVSIGQWSLASQPPTSARGPLSVHPSNPRYFTDGTTNPDGSLRAVYLAGSHVWNNMADIGQGDPPSTFDFDAYLDFLKRHHHNFIRLWRKEETTWDTRWSPEAGKRGVRNAVAPHPWARTGPGNALDGKPKFDLNTFDPAYFERLRSRVKAAGQREIYVSIMLFEGYVLQHVPNSWNDHPFHRDNNISGIDGDPNCDGLGLETHTLDIPAVTHLQETYIQHVIDAVGDLDNVLYEISNESGSYSTEWQSHLVRFIKKYEANRLKQHPVGMTVQWSRNLQHRGTNHTLIESPADWISLGSNVPDGRLYQLDPPPASGRKVILLDTDHLWGIGGNIGWVWKSFTRGYSPLFMDPYDNSVLGNTPPTNWNAMRASLGQTRRLADRVDLAAMIPCEELASTSYCLVQPNTAYIAYLPEGGNVTVDLRDTTGSFQVDWIAPVEGTIIRDLPTPGRAMQQFAAPYRGAAVLFLSRTR